MPDFKIHDDGCDELLVDGWCHRCGFAPDMQSTAWVSAYPARRGIMKERDALRARVAELEKELSRANEHAVSMVVAYNRELGRAQAAEHERDTAIADLAACRAERDKLNHCFICIECGRGAADEDGCCVTCGRDALMLDHGRLVNRDFADNLEADVRNQVERDTASQIASWMDGWKPDWSTKRDYGVQSIDALPQVLEMCASAIRSGSWRPTPGEVKP